MFYKIVLSLTFLILLGWYFREVILSFGLSWYFGAPWPRYQVKADHHVPITLSDSIELIADVYRPKGNEKFPTLLARTPYGRQNRDHHYEELGRLFASQGFVFIIQDVRGKEPSQGIFYPHKNEAKDGAETLSWIVKQPWSNGKIAFFGFSYLGNAAWQAASLSEIPLSTLMPWFAGSHPYPLWYDNGSPYLKQLVFWMCKYGGAGSENLLHQEVDRLLANCTDWQELDVLLTGHKIDAYRDFLAHPKWDGFWDQLAIPLSETIHDIPVLLGSGWYDQFLKTTIDDFKFLRQASQGSKRRESRLVLGPWTHHPTKKIKSFNLDRDASFLKQFSLLLKWCQKWMGSVPEFDLAPVTYYLMGKNQWKTAADWPPPEAKQVKFYLNASGENHLSLTPSGFAKRSLLFDPNHWIPSLGGRMLYSNGKEGPQDQSSLREREDVLIWSSSPLEQPLTIVGAAKLHLCLSETPRTFDLSIKLLDGCPEGKMQLITDGYSRIERNQEGIFAVDILLTDTAYVIPAHHRLQVMITHSDFPGHEPNPALLNTSNAIITILMGSQESSYVEILNLSENL